jgi:hypothetical protein
MQSQQRMTICICPLNFGHHYLAVKLIFGYLGTVE